MAITILITAVPLAPTMVNKGLAHKINVYAWLEGNTVFVEAHFGHGKKAQSAVVEVFNTAGAKLLEGKTDKNGGFSFKIPEVTDLRIVVRDRMGHRNSFIIPASELGRNQ
jgi:nickel transport protein